ncbi:hypothetical protein BDM02DRAFT_3122411 [Thelephora ganbajun]|uniref:Uncharacterized protein n=1 Tax=Thelephora ganbajun TaxID=370292 RepID=A0ACB6Z3H3_THEGA|nr:hypothetical protein BDM02DRAFT_3122411 [Thelephora ganbajun]
MTRDRRPARSSVRKRPPSTSSSCTSNPPKTYSHGESERTLGKALKVYNIPREEVVIMTELYAPVFKEMPTTPVPNPDEVGYVSKHDLPHTWIVWGGLR